MAQPDVSDLPMPQLQLDLPLGEAGEAQPSPSTLATQNIYVFGQQNKKTSTLATQNIRFCSEIKKKKTPEASWHVDLVGESCNEAAGGPVANKVLSHLTKCFDEYWR